MTDLRRADKRIRSRVRAAFPYLPALALVGMALTGCSHTASGVAQDASADTQKVGAAAQDAGKDVTRTARNADAGAAVTPEVKTAIIRDPVLNSSANLINVESKDHVTHLTGHAPA